MAVVFIPAQLQDLTAGRSRVEIQADTVREVVIGLEEQFPGIEDRLCDGAGLAPSLQVSIDSEISSLGLLAKVTPDSEVHFLPAIGGGA